MKGLYIHIPFCNNICTYCDFYKQYKSDLSKEYINALVKDIKRRDQDYDTIYIGGGTPSCLSLSELEKIFKVLNTDVLEFSIECNVSDINCNLLDLFSKYHVTRVSLGVQTFDDTLISVINRKHTKKDALEKLRLLREYSFIINIDMMFSLPNQTIAMLNQDLEVVKSLDIDSISYYSLILEEHTILYQEYLKDRVMLNDNDTEAEMYNIVIDSLTEYGYFQYENSNFTKEHKSLHNLIYWNCDEYYGVGCSAVERLLNKRYTTIKNTKKYIEAINNDECVFCDEETLTENDLMFEYLMMGLRLNAGVSVNKFKKLYNREMIDVFPIINQLIDENLVILKDNIYLTKRGLFLQNEVLVRLMECV